MNSETIERSAELDCEVTIYDGSTMTCDMIEASTDSDDSDREWPTHRHP